MSPLYILSSACISPQESFLCEDLMMEIRSVNNNMLTCFEPDFKHYINPVQIRRMSRALKIGFTSAMACLQKSAEVIPEAIIIGTGKGCLTDTEEFLHSIKEYKETALNATHFIHSTYNQLNGMISLSKKINSYNITYVHRGFSFEHSLMDASLLFDENEIETALVGSFDEMTQEHFDVKKTWGYWKSEMIYSFDLLDHKTKGTISGEGSAFFMLSKHKPDQDCVSIRKVATLFRPTRDELHDAIHEILRVNNLKLHDVDVLLSGANGDLNFADSYNDMHEQFKDARIAYFKHLCGEYDTATSFACWLAAQILLTQKLPDYLRPLRTRNTSSDKKIQTVLMYNNYFDVNQTLILLQLEEKISS